MVQIDLLMEENCVVLLILLTLMILWWKNHEIQELQVEGGSCVSIVKIITSNVTSPSHAAYSRKTVLMYM